MKIKRNHRKTTRMHKKTDVIVNAFDGKLTSKRTVTSQVLK